MPEPTRISASHFSKEVGRYTDLALTQPVVITRHGRDRTVMISAEEYGRLRHGSARAAAGASEGTAISPAGPLDAATQAAATAFLARIKEEFAPVAALLFGSRARGTHSPGSDADIAIVLQGAGKRNHVIGPLADAAYDVFMETGIYIQPLPLWESELQRPELFDNPALIENIKREGIRL